MWADTHSRGLENLRCLPRFHHLCQEQGIRPTYLVTWSVAHDAECLKIVEHLLRHGDCEVGMHPHLWETPPLQPQDYTSHASVAANYPEEILEEKISNLAELLTRRFGPIVSHRAGRWGLDARQVRILCSLGVQVDTSVTPGWDWSPTGAPDYSEAPLEPYWLDPKDLCQIGASLLLEVPCTIRPGWRLFGLNRRALVKAVLRRLNKGPAWLRCAPLVTGKQLIRVCDWAAALLPHLNLMSHSSEFYPGGSPYWRTAADVSHHLDLCSQVFNWWQAHGVQPMTLKEFGGLWSHRIGVTKAPSLTTHDPID